LRQRVGEPLLSVLEALLAAHQLAAEAAGLAADKIIFFLKALELGYGCRRPFNTIAELG
jgi:hypothetical protein